MNDNGHRSVREQTVGSQVREYRIHGMDCAEEVATLRDALKSLVDPALLGFDLLNGRMSVPAEVPPDRVAAAVGATGMRAETWRPAPDAGRRRLWSLRNLLVLVSGFGTATGFALHVAIASLESAIGSEGAGLAHDVPAVAKACYLAAVAAGLWLVFPKALFALRRLRPDMSLLMTIAVVGALMIGEWFEAATVSFLFALSLALEAWSIGRARRAVTALLELAPERARLVRDGKEIEVDPAFVDVGTVFRVRPGERIALDGRVERGTTTVDQSPVTGESMPVPKARGDAVYAGTINGVGVIDVLSTAVAGETTLARIIQQVGAAQAKRSRCEQWVERFARIYTPAILAVAAAVAIVPSLFGGQPSEWVYRALVLLVIGCPCALVIATPVAIVASLAAAARHGVLLKSGQIVEVPADIRIVALDKTGTLTEGRPRVVDVVPLAEHDERGLLQRAAALEAHSQHPIALAVLGRARELGLTPSAAEDVLAVHGKGLEGTVNGRRFWLGSHRYLEERGQETPDVHGKLESMSTGGNTIVVVGNDVHVCGLIAVADAVRTDSKSAIDALRRTGVERVVMLTGDNRGTAESVARAVGIDEVRAELMPEEKVRAVEDLENSGPVAMIGDGVNDAPALARATLGVAMGAAGTDAAIETADIALMADDLTKLAWTIAHARRTIAIVRVNTGVALGVKLVFAVLTFVGIASLWGAIAADMGASLVVVTNSLRLLRP